MFAVPAALVLVLAATGSAQTTNALSDAQIQGRELARHLCDVQPAENFTNTGHLLIRRKGAADVDLPIQFCVIAGVAGWQAAYETIGEGGRVKFLVVHRAGQNDFFEIRNGEKAVVPEATAFAGSDFWLCDLGLEFFHWPEQKILPNPTSLTRGRSYRLLESTDLNPGTNGYARVLSWIDLETGGILRAEAYDAQGRLLKVFEPKSFKKVDGQWQLQEMEIRNVQTGSRTRLEFNLNN